MTEMEILLNDYCRSYETMAKEIQEGIDEGFNEGIKEGIKQGFILGIKECRCKGFGNVEVKCMKEMFKDTLTTSPEEIACIGVKRIVSNEYSRKIGPSFRIKMEEACDKAVEDIRKINFELDRRLASGLKICVNKSVEKIKECIGNACTDMKEKSLKEKFQTDLIFGSFFEGLQKEFNGDLDKNLKACEERICKEIDSKVKN